MKGNTYGGQKIKLQKGLDYGNIWPSVSGTALTDTHMINLGSGIISNKDPLPSPRVACITGTYEEAGGKFVIVAGGKNK